MCKIQVSVNAIKRAYNKIVSLKHKELPCLLRYKTPLLYNKGKYNTWNCDVYIHNGVAITRGYKPFGNIKGKKYKHMFNSYENKAKKISKDNKLSYDEKEKEINNIFDKFIMTCKYYPETEEI